MPTPVLNCLMNYSTLMKSVLSGCLPKDQINIESYTP
jgi:hypothetical protein